MDILSFNFNKSKIRTILDKYHNIWFIGKDVAELLRYKRPSDAVTQHCKNVFSQNEFHKLHGDLPHSLDSRLKLIPESDVWRLIIKSQMPEAEKVEKWIFEEVLPQIRKTGSYSISQQKTVSELSEYLEFVEMAKQFLTISKPLQPFEILQIDNILSKFGKDKFSKLLDFDFSEAYFSVTDLGKISGKSGSEINQVLAKIGLQTFENGVWQVSEIGKNLCFETKNQFSQLKWKSEVLDRI